MSNGTARPRLSIVIPTLQEAADLDACLNRVAALRARGHEVIVVDGGSRDATVPTARGGADLVLQSARGRARQMNVGARAASGDALLFLHADTRLPEDADQLILAALATGGRVWGRFDVRLSGSHWLFTVIATMMNLRSRVTGVATGDQGMFMRSAAFRLVGGFPDIPLMEDVEMSRLLKRLGRPACLRQRAVTSSRRWERQGILRTVFLMWGLRLAHALGVPPERLVRVYYRSGDNA